MTDKPGIKVGIIAIIALAIFGAFSYYLSHFDVNTYTIRVRFNDTNGLVKQSVVRMRGVVVGEVKKVELEGLQPVVTLAIQDKIKIPAGSKFIIITGILITNPLVEIDPVASSTNIADNATVEGSQGVGALQALSPELQNTVTNLNKTFADLQPKLNKSYAKIDRLLDQAQVLVKNVNETVVATKSVVADQKLRTALTTTVTNFRDLSQNAKDTSVSLKKTVTSIAESSKGSFQQLTTKLTNILTRIDSTIDDANSVVKKLTEQVTDPRLQQSLQETTELARTTLARFDQIAADIHQLTGDAELQANLKSTVAHLNSATEKGEQAINKVNSLLGNVSNGASAARKLRIPPVTVLGNVSEQLDPTRLRVDVEARIGAGRDIANVGLYDLGQDTRLTLQAGKRVTDTVLMRYGLYASKLGAGLEWTSPSGLGFRGDLFDTNRPRLDLRGSFRVNNDASIWLGGEQLFRHPVPVVGVEIRK